MSKHRRRQAPDALTLLARLKRRQAAKTRARRAARSFKQQQMEHVQYMADNIHNEHQRRFLDEMLDRQEEEGWYDGVYLGRDIFIV